MNACLGQRRMMPLDVICHIGREVASALGYAHALHDEEGRPLDLHGRGLRHGSERAVHRSTEHLHGRHDCAAVRVDGKRLQRDEVPGAHVLHGRLLRCTGNRRGQHRVHERLHGHPDEHGWHPVLDNAVRNRPVLRHDLDHLPRGQPPFVRDLVVPARRVRAGHAWRLLRRQRRVWEPGRLDRQRGDHGLDLLADSDRLEVDRHRPLHGRQHLQPSENQCAGFRYAGCGGASCTVGQTACSYPSATYDVYLVCGANGEYNRGAASHCATTAVPDGVCIVTASGTGSTCGDPACGKGNPGVCDATGKYHVCNNDFTVNPAVTGCATGVCVPTTNGLSDAKGNVAGACKASCQDGDQMCLQAGLTGNYEVCVGGLWSPSVKTCAGGSACIDTTSSTARPSTFCGVCLPGTTRCNGTAVQTCATDGMSWGANTACAMGTCQNELDGDKIQGFCRVQCVPNTMQCSSASVTSSGGYPARSGTVSCDSKGILGQVVECATGVCRWGPSANGAFGDNPYYANGVVLGCVVCVGTQNAFGNPDTRCTDSTGSGALVNNGGYVETCNATTNAWDPATLSQCTGNFSHCENADTFDELGGFTPPAPAFCNYN